jgi:hypothetical protein
VGRGACVHVAVDHHVRAFVEGEPHGGREHAALVLAQHGLAEGDHEGHERHLRALQIAENESVFAQRVAAEPQPLHRHLPFDVGVAEVSVAGHADGREPRDLERGEGRDVGELHARVGEDADVGDLAQVEIHRGVQARAGGLDGELVERDDIAADQELPADGGPRDAHHVFAPGVVEGFVEHLEALGVDGHGAAERERIEGAAKVLEAPFFQGPRDVRVGVDAEVAHEPGELEPVELHGPHVEGFVGREGRDLRHPDAHDAVAEGDGEVLHAHHVFVDGDLALQRVREDLAVQAGLARAQRAREVGQVRVAVVVHLEVELHAARRVGDVHEAVREGGRDAGVNEAVDRGRARLCEAREAHTKRPRAQLHLAPVARGQRTRGPRARIRIQIHRGGDGQAPHAQLTFLETHAAFQAAERVLVDEVLLRLAPGERMDARDLAVGRADRGFQRTAGLGRHVHVELGELREHAIDIEIHARVGDRQRRERQRRVRLFAARFGQRDGEVLEFSVAHDRADTRADHLHVAHVELAAEQRERPRTHRDALGLEQRRSAIAGVHAQIVERDAEGPEAECHLVTRGHPERAGEPLARLLRRPGPRAGHPRRHPERDGHDAHEGEHHTQQHRQAPPVGAPPRPLRGGGERHPPGTLARPHKAGHFALCHANPATSCAATTQKKRG